MKILYIAVEPIYPTDTGSRIRDYQLIKAMSKKHTVELAYLSAEPMPVEPDPPYTAAYYVQLPKALATLTALDKARYLVKAVLKRSFPLSEFLLNQESTVALLEQVGRSQPTVVVLQSSYLLPLARFISQRYPDVALILDAHNIEWQLQQRMAMTSSTIMKPIKRLMAANLAKWERSAGRYVAAVAAVSQSEAQWWQTVCPQTTVMVVPNGVDVDFFKPKQPLPTQPVISFCGSMSYLPNDEGALWFYHQVWPLLSQQLPDVKWLIIGKDPSAEVRALASRSITITGRVDDVRGWLEQSRVSVVPLLAGGGTRLKILEAMSMKRVVVSTSLGAEGIEAGDGLVLADTPQAMTDKILAMLRHPKLSQLGAMNRRRAEQDYSWPAIGRTMVELVEKAVR